MSFFMNTSILQLFLEDNLLNIQIDDPTFVKLTKAAEALQKKELKKKSEIPRFLLIAIDPNVNVNEPVLSLIKEHITKKSQTILSKSKDTPITLLRAIALEALWNLCQTDLVSARIVWLLGSNVINQFEFGREEKVIVHQFLKGVGERVEQAAIEQWKLIPASQKPKIPAIFKPIDINSSVFETDLEIGENLNSTPYTRGNAHSTAQCVETWKNLFGPAIETELKAIAIDLSKHQNKNIHNAFERLNKTLQASLKSSQEYLHGIGNSILSTNESLSNRSTLLWWKEALYSSTQQTSYREINTVILPIVMAYDLYCQINIIYPVSIDFFLKETLLKLLPENEKKSLNDLIVPLKEESHKPILQSIFPTNDLTEGRICLSTYIHHFILNGSGTLDEFEGRVGINPTREISMTEFAVWIFHELQAFRLINQK